MTTFERIKELADHQGISIKQLATNLDFGENAIYKWKNQNPTIDKLQKVADYFHVSIDYLIGRTEQRQLDHPDATPEDDLSVLFRLNTDGLSNDNKDKLRDELERFMKFAADEMKKSGE